VSYPARTAHHRLKPMKHDLTLDQLKKKQDSCYVDYSYETLTHLNDTAPLTPPPTYPSQHWTTRDS
jgi:hypothetical protein